MKNKVMNDLEHRVEAYGLQDAVVDVQAPGEMVTEVKKRGEKDVTSTKDTPLATLELNISVLLLSTSSVNFEYFSS